ncbi:uncharacterized protein MELLADRAFT_102253 [Melampsora larici-populina 98AG31]|uniref:Uncharacterized protein n=1 Tax=Melampsora larici-populina (strain 98AG31 / pathotype 3-4-7) TaxID=747676 RepID=F4R7P4_MELLP|nr:uncharacterized protein MELLADRAFT_102253 [Melampsora larici-populina 98AG31]EGG11749.1 hypothetical protein MELLADRAFT_102253 [Melampsora larici-populina 98AG31]
MSFQVQLDQTRQQLYQSQTQPNQSQPDPNQNKLDLTREKSIQANGDQVIQNKESNRVLTQAEAVAKGIQPGQRLQTPRQGAIGKNTKRGSKGSNRNPKSLCGVGIPKRGRRPIGIKKAKGIGKRMDG